MYTQSDILWWDHLWLLITQLKKFYRHLSNWLNRQNSINPLYQSHELKWWKICLFLLAVNFFLSVNFVEFDYLLLGPQWLSMTSNSNIYCRELNHDSIKNYRKHQRLKKLTIASKLNMILPVSSYNIISLIYTLHFYIQKQILVRVCVAI